MTLLEIDNKALIPPPPTAAAPVAPAPVESGEPGPEQIWREPASRLLARLKTKIGGLTTAEARSRLASYGANDASDVKTVPLWRQFLVRFENPLIIILLIASGVSALTGGMASFVVIVVIVMLSVVFDFVQDVRAQNAVASLRASVSVQATVQTRRRSRLGSDQPIGAWRYRRTGRRRSRSRRTRVCSKAGTSTSTRRC